MADRHGSIPVKQKFGNRQTHDLAAAQNNGLLSRNFNISSFQELDYSHGRARYDTGIVRPLLPERSGIQRMKTVHVLLTGNSLDDLSLAYLFGERQLDQDSVHLIIGVKFCYLVQDFLFRRFLGEPECRVLEPDHLAGLFLVPDIGLASRIITDQNHYQVRHPAVFFRKCRHLFRHFGLQFGRKVLSANYHRDLQFIEYQLNEPMPHPHFGW